MFYKDKTILVAGGTGFVGTHIVQQLIKQGARVRVPIHKRPLAVQDKRVETFDADLTREEDCLAAVEGVDYVFQLAGAVGSAAVTPAHAMADIATNLVLTSRMLHAAWAGNVKRVLMLSSSTVYPPAEYPVREEDAWSGPTYLPYFGYGWMKRYLERLGEYVASHSNVKIALARPTAVYGQWDNFDPASSHVVPALVRKAVERQDPYEVWGTGQEVRDFLDVRDLARASLLMLERYAVCDPVNIGYGRAVTIKEIVQIVLKAAGYSNARVQFNSSKPTTAPIRMVDTSKAKKLLDFEPEVSLEEGLTDTVKWYSQLSEDGTRGRPQQS